MDDQIGKQDDVADGGLRNVCSIKRVPLLQRQKPPKTNVSFGLKCCQPAKVILISICKALPFIEVFYG